MSSEEIMKKGEEFNTTYEKAKEIIKSIKNKTLRKSDLENIHGMIDTMSRIIDSIELEVSLISKEMNSDNVEKKIAVGCRDNYNKLRKEFADIEGKVTSRALC